MMLRWQVYISSPTMGLMLLIIVNLAVFDVKTSSCRSTLIRRIGILGAFWGGKTLWGKAVWSPYSQVVSSLFERGRHATATSMACIFTRQQFTVALPSRCCRHGCHYRVLSIVHHPSCVFLRAGRVIKMQRAASINSATNRPNRRPAALLMTMP